jgi:TonB family protein
VLYGNPAFGDERVLLDFAADGATQLARVSEAAAQPWMTLGQWRVENELLAFADSRTGREFRADLARSTLGGSWQTLSMIGGWWCTEVESGGAGAGVDDVPTAEARALMPPLVASVMATPSYPLEALHRGVEGRAVVCFVVDGQGAVSDPEIVELSDEVFREATLNALSRSSYRPWGDDEARRPACRSYIFRLDPIPNPPPP